MNKNSGNRPIRIAKFLSLLIIALPGLQAQAQVVASDMTGSSSQNLTSFNNPFNGAISSAGDGFQKYQRGVSSSIPFSVLDDSVSIFPADSLGIIDEGNLDVFFGVTDTVNGDNTGPVSATWVFDIASGTDLALSIDMGAMGDFESSDSFTWTYSIDSGATMTAFAAAVDEAGANTYTLAGGAMFTLNDPMTLQGTVLTNVLATFGTLISGTGSELTLTLTADTNGGSEAFAFQNIEIKTGGLPLQAVAFDMVDSGEQNLTSFSNPFNGAFSSAGDGFQKYQRGVSSSIPFSVLDDSLSIFTSDSLGIIDEGNLDVFFGVTDTVNSDNSGPVSATWVFDIIGGTDLALSIDMGAMGDFESSDSFTWTYSIDGGPTMTAFANGVDEAGAHTYTLEGGASFTLNDPMTMQGTVLTNVLTTFTTSLSGSGSELQLTLTADTNGGSEAFVFQNIVIAEGMAPEPPQIAEIFEIQGAGTASPFAGDTIESLNNVVTALAPNGFFMQTPESRSDNDVDTSDGIFVFTGGAPMYDAVQFVAVGDMVDVTGNVVEFFGFTEFSNNPTVVFRNSGMTLPAAVQFDASTPSPDPMSPSCAIEFECYEGMLVEIANGTVTGPNQRFNSDPVAEVHITAAPDRTFREIGIEYPGLPDLPVWDGNPEVFELDPDKLGLTNQIIPAGSSFSASGVVGFEFGGYEFWPTELTVTAAVIPQGVRARQRAEFTIGSLNMFRLFDDVDDPADTSVPGRTRDDAVISTAEYERRRAKFADYILNVLDAPDILAVQEVEKLEVLETLAADITEIEPSVVYSAYLVEGNDIGTIDVGFLVRDTVAVDAITQLGKDEILIFDNSLLNDRPPLLLEGRSVNEGADYPITVMVVHNRSLGGIDSSSRGPRVRAKRLAQAQSIAAKVQAMQTDNPDVRLVIIGDFNAFEFTDGYVDAVGQIAGNFDPDDNLLSGDDLVDPDLINQVLSVSPDERYSFIFRGNAQALDHALTSIALDNSVRGLEYGRGNADAAVDRINAGDTVLRASDHDGLVLFLTKDIDGDGVNDDADVCPGTTIPEMPSKRLGVNRFALTDGDFMFDTTASSGVGPRRSYSTEDTAGCSCTQIIGAQELGRGHTKFGCSIEVMDDWVQLVQ